MYAQRCSLAVQHGKTVDQIGAVTVLRKFCADLLDMALELLVLVTSILSQHLLMGIAAQCEFLFFRHQDDVLLTGDGIDGAAGQQQEQDKGAVVKGVVYRHREQ